MAKLEMETIIHQKPSKITVLTIIDVEHDRQFQRIDHKEFRYNGHMYDVLREIKKGRTSVFICLPDSKESKLFAGFKRLNQNKHYTALWDNLLMIFISVPSMDLCPSVSGNLIYPRIEISLKSLQLPTWSPPPEFS